ncbi:hypothetical protein EZ313_14760 [Ramlibacter henchirensis]|uniref:Uncharacterized protein n=1 Tax=Ramlibacter henchirensis TaxID=204072 RepID=A0A4Z0BX06_9BURK|nr:hypothetical protein [Ramlibacter henchirensis]TFZ02519.1 hypothetical protein EZ313_14760 [Ramlibacter henchirensis]
MNLLSFFIPSRKPNPGKRQEHRPGPDQRGSVRREIVKLSLRETLVRARVPAEWVGFELLPVAQQGTPHVAHVRLILSQWDGRPVYSIFELERSFMRRMKLLDSTSSDWVRGISWRLALPLARMPVAAETMPNEPAGTASPAPAKSANVEPLLEPDREQQYASRGDHPDFSPTQPML